MNRTSSSEDIKAPHEPGNALSSANGPPESWPLWTVFAIFLRLGLTSFGGPIAHLGYFRSEFVERRKWLDDAAYAELLALCQFLPGPASSQMGMALGMRRAGLAGAVAAWAGFTLPSALLMFGLGYGWLQSVWMKQGAVISALLIISVAVVAQAVHGMAKNLCPDPLRAWIAVLAGVVCLLIPHSLSQFMVIAVAGLVTAAQLPWHPKPVDAPNVSTRFARRLSMFCLVLFFVLLAGLPWLAWSEVHPLFVLLDNFYRAGALVFGGGHVVLPLLQAMFVPVHMEVETFLAGYAAAQAMPGPLFTIAAYLGAVMPGAFPPWMSSLVALIGIFLPGFLLVIAAMPFWQQLMQVKSIGNAFAGMNAAVVGVLLASLYDPIFVHAVREPHHMALALIAFAALHFGRISPLWIVLVGVAGAGLVELYAA